jgi:mycofactocin system glycosyltransferase
VTPQPAPDGVRLDRSLKVYGNVLIGGEPVRMMRLSPKGRDALRGLGSGSDLDAATRSLGDRLIEAGMAHPTVERQPATAHVTVIIPVRDRAEALGHCLAALGGTERVIVVDDGSSEPDAIIRVARRHAATLIRHAEARGPGAARNSALGQVQTEFVAFLDSDCLPEPGWIEALIGHFADPRVAAVAPRVRPEPPAPTANWRQRFIAARSPLDLGTAPSAVFPGGRVSYVPTAALLARMCALQQAFDPRLRYGEDVDFVWRLYDAGWRVRYEPGVSVLHSEPRSWRRVLARRMRYGTSAAPLEARHRGRLAPLVAMPMPTMALLMLLARRHGGAAAAVVLHASLIQRRVRSFGLPRSLPIRWAVASVGWTLLGIGRASTILAMPGLALALLTRRSRAFAFVLLVAPPLHEWLHRRPGLDPVRWVLGCVVDDAAYGLGVWRGCLDHRTLAPVVPRLRPPR